MKSSSHSNSSVVVTSIATPSDKILKYNDIYSNKSVWVSDKKTPVFDEKRCINLSLSSQTQAPLACLADVLPYNHYSRKNLGYIYAHLHLYPAFVLDTDDDNFLIQI